MEDIITNAYSVGGIGFAVVISIISAIKWLFGQFKSLNEKIDNLKEQITDLKVSQEKYIQMIKNCSNPDCPNRSKI